MKYNHPTDIPRSKDLFFDWTSDRIVPTTQNIRGDTYPQTWADDDGLYIGTGDPNWMVKNGENYVMCAELGNWNENAEVYECMSGCVLEKLTGEPQAFGLTRVNDMRSFIGLGGGGPKPSGMICVDGKLYYAVQNLLGSKPPRHRTEQKQNTYSQHGSDATILCSEDHGQTWTNDISGILDSLYGEQYIRKEFYWRTPADSRAEHNGWKPMFSGNLFGGPSFVQFGKNNADAVDDYVYAVSGDHWDNGRDLRLGRVSKDKILDRAAWQFAIPQENGDPVWTADVEQSAPILEIDRHISLPEMVYIKSLNKYLLLTWALHTDFRTPTGSELTILESDKPWGPFSLVHYDWMWYNSECAAYTPRVPLKWFNQETLEGFLLFSGSWESQVPYYLPQLRGFKLIRRTDNCR